MKINLSIVLVFIVSLLLAVISETKISYAHGDKAHAKKLNEEIGYSKNIKPLFDEKCIFCHGEESVEHTEFMKDMKKYTSQSFGPRLDNYTYLTSFIVWPETGAMMRMLDDGKSSATGKPGAMYENLGDTEKERQTNLKVFKDWVGNWTLKKWDQISKEEINKIKLGY